MHRHSLTSQVRCIPPAPIHHRRSNSRASSLGTRSSIQQPPPSAATPSSFVTAQEPEDNEDDYQSARILFDFSPGSEFELGVSGELRAYSHPPCHAFLTRPPHAEGNVVYILEPDDGSGWVKVSPSPTGVGKNGLVPASYVELVGDSESAGIPRTTQAASDSAGSEKGASLCLCSFVGLDEVLIRFLHSASIVLIPVYWGRRAGS